MSRLRRIRDSLFAIGVSQLLNIVGHVVVTPMYLVYWGAPLYGIWLSISAAISYIMYADLGLAAYVMPRLMRSYVNEDWEAVDSDLHSATAAALVLFGAAFAIAAAIALGFLLSGADRELVAVGSLMAATGLLALLQGFVTLPYNVSGHQQRTHFSTTLYGAALLACNVTVLMAHGRPIHLASAHAAVTAVRVLATWWDGSRIAPRLQLGIAKATLAKVRELLPRSFERGLASIITVLGKQGTLLAVSASIGPSAATTLSTSRTLVNFSRMSSEMLGNAVYTEFADLDARNDQTTLARLLRIASGAAMAVTFPILSVLFVVGPEIFESWMRGKLAADTALLVLLCVEAFTMMPIVLVRMVLLATNQHRLSVWADAVTTVLTIAGTFIGTRWFGVLAAPLSILVLQAPWFGTVVVTEIRRVTQQRWSWRTLALTWLKGTFLMLLGCAWCWSIAAVTPDVLVRGLVGLVGAQGLGLAVWWFWMLDPPDRQMVVSRVRGVLVRLRGTG